MACIIHVTDIHGSLQFCEKVFDVARQKKVKAVLVGGDICPPFNRDGQRIFLEQYFIKRVRDFHEDTGIPLYAIMGNDDYAQNADILLKAHREGILKYVDRRKEKLSDYHVIGYPFVNPTPFLLKDWEKEEEQIEADLERLMKGVKKEKAVMLFHAPPYDTSLDILHYGAHCGSLAIRKFIEEHQPYITLHGHIHESPQKSGMISGRIGRTTAINPGSQRILMLKLTNLNMNIID